MVINPSPVHRNKLQNVPAFLNKLYNMVDDSSTNELIRWSDDGLSFIVIRHEEFAKKVLPRFFKHSNFSSFVRQLNMYGFHKVPHLQNGVLNTAGETERWEFSNPHFQRNQPDLLLLVTRKKGRDPEEKEAGTVDLHHILDEIAAIKKHQMSISNELKNVQNDNQILWQENIATKERHHRHQETIDKILRFLASVFSSDKNKHVVTPRKRQYLLGDGSQKVTSHDKESLSPSQSNKKRRYSKIEDVDEDNEPALKLPRKSPIFNISDYVNDAHDIEREITGDALLTPIQEITSPTLSPATADLQAAIALNDQTKKDNAASLVTVPPLNLTKLNGINSATSIDTTTPTTPVNNTLPDLTALFNSPQFQGLVNLAQTNPALFNQLTNSNYFDISNPFFAPKSDNTDSSSSPNLSDTATSTVIDTPNTVNTPTSSTAMPTTAEDLESSLKTLANELGLETENDSNNHLDYVNMDDFLNTYTEEPSNTANESSNN
ncbi:MAG: hypothetical protein EXX96DRAFT_502878 [Benjaminiella poitrasii]|nr:MAG: hypothetical protein EXX96DRAFT_502878 [Benjaminiella poitrasii]